MRKILLLVLCLMLAFYVGWPLWSAYQIRTALERNDTALLERKIDFPSVRASMAPAVGSEVDRALDRALNKGDGVAGAVLGGNLKSQLAPKIVETVLASLVTPQALVELYARRGDIKEFVAEKMGKMGGLPGGIGGSDGSGAKLPGGIDIGMAKDLLGKFGGSGAPGGVMGGNRDKSADAPAATPAAKPTGSADAKPAAFGLGNIKRFSPGLTSYEIGIAKEAATSLPDLTARLAFTGGDWKLVGLVPKVQ